jgi:NADPH:quinone reductase-like Zn-dependent oxidoreductase
MAPSIPDKMKAAALDRFGGPEVLGIKTVPVPTCGDDEILIRVEGAGVGVWDSLEREGEMAGLMEGKPHFPYVPGTDGAGEVVAVGGNVRRFKVGDRVYATAFLSPKGGFYAEFTVTKEKHAARIPKGMKVEQAAALAADGITALQGLEDTLRLQAGQRLLIFGASGGVGHIAVQLARRLGARVLAVASGEDGVELVRRLGAEAVVEGHHGEVEKACRDFAPDGLDAALVLACNDRCLSALKHVRQGGRIAYPNGVEPIPQGPEGVEVIAYDGVPRQQTLERLNELIEAGPFHVEIGHVYAMEEAVRAQKEVLQHHLGKLTLRIH